MRTWRDKAAEVVRATLAANAGKSEPEIRKALREAYPFGPREHYPYKVWLDEVKRQRGQKLSTGPCSCTHSKGAHRSKGGSCGAADCSCPAYSPAAEGQTELFA